MEIQFFDDSLEKFIFSLEEATIAKAFRTIDLLEKFGYKLGMPHSKNLENNLFELRIRGNQELRIIYTFHKNSIIFLHCFIKKSRKTSKKELAIALKRFRALTAS